MLKSFKSSIFILMLLSLSVIFLGLFTGDYPLSFQSILSNNKDLLIFFQYRLPRVLLTYFVGSGLAIAGLLFQNLFRNNLMTPFTLGIAGTASLGASLWIHFGALSSLMLVGLHFSALLGSFLGMSILCYLIKSGKRYSCLLYTSPSPRDRG